MKRITAVLFLVFALSAAAFAQVKTIDTYSRSVEKLYGKKTPDLVFADVKDYNDEGPEKWQKFDSAKALEKFRETNESYSIAYNWTKKGQIVMTAFTLFSPSGDWVQYDTYFFRENGKLAKIISEIRTFMGDVIIDRNFYFDATGKQTSMTKKYRDLRTKKYIKKPSDSTFDSDDIDVYKTVKDLPFAKLMP
jgi:hypothetical protein